MPGLQFYIELIDSNPHVWRRIVVPYEYTFYKLHLVIQGALGWENYHLFQFSETGFLDKVCYGEVTAETDSDPEHQVKDAKRSKIKQVFNHDQKRFNYIYDFGDNWKHHVVFEKFVDEDIERPYCIEGKNACPPEDCGGIGGYAAMIEALKEPDNPEGGNYREWLNLGPDEEWDPTLCNVREINKRLCLLE